MKYTQQRNLILQWSKKMKTVFSAFLKLLVFLLASVDNSDPGHNYHWGVQELVGACTKVLVMGGNILGNN